MFNIHMVTLVCILYVLRPEDYNFSPDQWNVVPDQKLCVRIISKIFFNFCPDRKTRYQKHQKHQKPPKEANKIKDTWITYRMNLIFS